MGAHLSVSPTTKTADIEALLKAVSLKVRNKHSTQEYYSGVGILLWLAYGKY